MKPNCTIFYTFPYDSFIYIDCTVFLQVHGVVLPSILPSIEYFNFNWAFQYSRFNTLETLLLTSNHSLRSILYFRLIIPIAVGYFNTFAYFDAFEFNDSDIRRIRYRYDNQS